MDSMAEHQKSCGQPTVAIQWGAWSSVGKRCTWKQQAFTAKHSISCKNSRLPALTAQQAARTQTRKDNFLLYIAQMFNICNLNAGMVHDKRQMSSQQSAAMGMLDPNSGLQAMAALLGQAGVSGVATPTYWRLLLKQVKQLPDFWSGIEMTPSQVGHCCIPTYVSSQRLLQCYF